MGLILALVVIGIVSFLALWLLPIRQQRGWTKSKEAITPAESLDLIVKYRGTLAQIIGGTLLFIGLYFTWRTLDLTRQGLVSDRFAKAVAFLGSEDASVRVGGVAALDQLTHEYPDLRWPIMDLLAAYIRSRAASTGDDSAASKERHTSSGQWRAADDIQAALNVLKDQEWSQARQPLNLNDADLSGADLTNARFQRASLRGTDLTAAHLPGAKLAGSNLMDAILRGANLERADLTGACVAGADLRGAKRKGAIITPEQERTLQSADRVLEIRGAAFSNALTVAKHGAKLSFGVTDSVDVGAITGVAIQLVGVAFRGTIRHSSPSPFDFDMGLVLTPTQRSGRAYMGRDRTALFDVMRTVGSTESLHVVVQRRDGHDLVTWTAAPGETTGDAKPGRKLYFDPSPISLPRGRLFVQLYAWTYWDGASVELDDMLVELRYRELEAICP